ncbi:hypothetical protein MRX96_023731 [Rhipicephalus microplus]
MPRLQALSLAPRPELRLGSTLCSNRLTAMQRSRTSSSRSHRTTGTPLARISKKRHRCSLQRITNDITDVIENPPAGIYAAPHEDDIDRVHALVVGNAGTPYEGGFFHFLIRCPPKYPVSPPRVRLMNTDGGRITFHPYLHETGRVLLDMLGNGSTTAPWSSLTRISDLLVTIQSLLSPDPFLNVSNLDADVWRSSSALYNCLVQHETIRVAVCDAIEACLDGTSQCPPELRNVMMRSFLEHYDNYEAMVMSNRRQTSTMWLPHALTAHGEESFQYSTLLNRLRELRLLVHERLNPGHEGTT